MAKLSGQIFESHQHQGFWWTPGNQDDAKPGTLTYDPQTRAYLEVLGELKEFSSGGEHGVPLNVIHGFTTSGIDVSLLRPFSGRGNWNYPGITTQQYSSDALILGAHVDGVNVPVERARLRLSHISRWAGRDGFVGGFPDLDNKASTTLRFERPEPITAPLDNGITLTISFPGVANASKVPRPRWEMEQQTIISLASDKPRSLSEMRKLALDVRDLLSLLVGRPVALEEFQIQLSLSEEERENILKTRPVFLIQRTLPLYDSSDSVHQSEMLLPLSALESRLASVVNRWLGCSKNFELVLDFYFGTVYEPTVHIKRHFFELAVAAEAYHKRSTQNRKVYFRERLRALAERHGQVTGSLIDPESFSKDVKTKRDALAHGGPGSEEEIGSGTPMVTLILQLRTLLEACFLDEIGIPAEEAAERMRRKISMRSEGLYV